MTDVMRQLVEQVAAARADGTTLEIVGGGSKKDLGRDSAADAILDIGGHTGIVKYEPVELVLTARAGTPLQEIQEALAGYGQWLACDPPLCAGRATLGGALACNQSGPTRPWSGSMRDALLGIRLLDGRAEQLRFGGEVMKNVAGYDVSRAQAGAFGTLGVITELSLKVMPRPARDMTLVQEMDAHVAIVRMNELAGQPRPLAGACWHDGRLYLRLQGEANAVQNTAARWGGEIQGPDSDFWQTVREQQHGFFAGSAPLWRFSIRSSAPHWREQGDWFFDWCGAQRWLRGEYARQELEQEAGQAGGQVTLHRGGDRRGEVFASLSAPVQAIHHRLKAAFDPRGVFNPGRLYSWM